MSEKNGFFTKKGFLFISGSALLIAIITLLVGWNHIQKFSDEPHQPLTLKECAPLHEGTIFQKDAILVKKDVAFCNPIAEHEKIPPHVVIDLGNGQLVLPSEETATTAIFPVTFKYVADKDWHVIAKE